MERHMGVEPTSFSTKDSSIELMSHMVRVTGLEPAHLSIDGFKPPVSAIPPHPYKLVALKDLHLISLYTLRLFSVFRSAVFWSQVV